MNRGPDVGILAKHADRYHLFKDTLRGICGSLALALGLAIITPSTAAAQSQARVCVHVPNGSNYDSDYAPFVLVVRDPSFWEAPSNNLAPGRSTRAAAFLGANDIGLAVNFDLMMPVDVRAQEFAAMINLQTAGQGQMNFGYNCRFIDLGIPGERFIRSFDLNNVPYIDAVVYGPDDFCANEVYIQRFENGEVRQTRRFLAGDQRCWGDDISGARYYHTLTGQAIAAPEPVFASASGRWTVVCRTVNCLYTASTTVTAGEGGANTRETTMSTTTTSSISVGLEYEGFSAEASMSREEMRGVTNSVTRNFSNSLSRTMARTVPYSPEVRQAMNIASIWQYTITNVMDDGSEVEIVTDFFGCSSSDFAPTFFPGTTEATQSCQGGLVVPTSAVPAAPTAPQAPAPEVTAVAPGAPTGTCPSFSTPGSALAYSSDDVYSAQTLSLTAGGFVNLTNCESIPNTVGYVTGPPDYSLQYTSLERGRALEFRVTAECDTVLLINTTNGTWVFNDDDTGANPRLRVDAAVDGRYDIWVGTYGTGSCAANLVIESF